MATHPWQMVNHPEEDSIQIPPPNHQVVHIYCQKIKSETNISYPEARRFVSATNDSPTQKSYASVAKRVFNSVETQTMFTWIVNTEI
jgi:hypothetical protein